MFNSKLTKVAFAVALTATAGSALANKVSYNKITAAATAGASTNTAATLPTKAKELSAAVVADALHAVDQASVASAAAAEVNVIVFETNSEALSATDVIELNVTNGGFNDNIAGVQIVDITDLDNLNFVGSQVTAANFLRATKDSTNSYITSLRFTVPEALPINRKYAILEAATGADTNGFGYDSTNTTADADTAFDPLNLYVARGLNKGDKVSVGVKVINGTTLTEISERSATTAANLVDIVDGFTATKATAVTHNVDFTKDAFVFVSGTGVTNSNYTSGTTTGASVTVAGGLDIGEAGDTYNVTVTGSNCAAVNTKDTDAVSFGGVNLTYQSGCTWSVSNNTDIDANLLAGGSNLLVTVNNGTAATTASPNTKIESATWTYSVDVKDDDTSATYSLFSGATALTWSGNVQGTNAYIPYMYATDIAGYLSIAKLTNNTAKDVNVGVTVVLDDVDADGTDYSGKEMDIFVTTIKAGEMATINGNMIKAAIEGKDSAGEALTIPANRGFKTSGFKTLASEGFNYHMNVSFTFDGATDADGVDVTLQNAGPNSRANGTVFYGSARTKD